MAKQLNRSSRVARRQSGVPLVILFILAMVIFAAAPALLDILFTFNIIAGGDGAAGGGVGKTTAGIQPVPDHFADHHLNAPDA